MTITSKETKKKVTKTLYYNHTFDINELIGGGILNSSGHIERELWVDSKVHPIFDPEKEEWIPSDEIQLHLGGTRRAIEELGTILIALARFEKPYPQYSLQFDLIDVQGKPPLHLILHIPIDDISEKSAFPTIHNVAKAVLDDEGNIIRKTTGVQ